MKTLKKLMTLKCSNQKHNYRNIPEEKQDLSMWIKRSRNIWGNH